MKGLNSCLLLLGLKLILVLVILNCNVIVVLEWDFSLICIWILFLRVNLMVLLYRLRSICCNCKGLFINEKGMFIFLIIKFRFFDWVFKVIIVVSCLSNLFRLNGMSFNFSLLVFIFEKFRMLLMMFINDWVVVFIVFRK